ncbi:WG repeat-containing protein [Butyrivibrio fibrisolvens]|uniref:WG repeat-containing protein n=1 Tax=Butyrivibrio fibrisolvens TaxID=831 RepID=UPI00042699E7|nr:WG repeat-containing protein [Butyrivibrio fibrisolvens]
MKKKKELLICAIAVLLFLSILFFFHMFCYKQGNWYLIDSSGNLVSKTGYEDCVGVIEIEGEMHFILTRKNRFSPESRFYRETMFVVNKNGEVILQDSTGENGNLNYENFHALFYKGKRVFLDSKGQIIFTVPDNVTLEECYSYRLGMMPFYYNDVANPKYGYMNIDGEVVIEPQFSYAELFSEEGLAAVRDDEGKWGYIDTEGNLVIPQVYDFTLGFDAGFALVEKEHDEYYIDITGRKVLDIDGGVNKEGFTYISNDEGKYACIDLKGNQITDYIFDRTILFKNGYACGCVNGLYGCIDKTGEFVIEPSFEYIGDFSDFGIALAKGKDGLYGYINIKASCMI